MKTEKLLFALKLAQPCVVGIDYVPILQHFCFNKQQVFAYDNISAIVVGFESDLHCALRANTLLQLATLGAEDVALAQGKDAVEFSSGTTKASLPLLPPEEFAFEERKAEKGAVQFTLTGQLFTALQVCAAGIGKDPHYKVQTAVVMVTGKSSALYAFDGTSIVKCALSDPIGEARRVVLIPQSVCEDIKHIVNSLDCKPEEVTVSLGKESLTVEFQHAEWNVRLIGTLLTDKLDIAVYETEISNAEKNAVLLRMDEEFMCAVDKVAVVLANEIDKECYLELAGGNIEVYGEGTLGKARTVLKARSGLKASAALTKAKATAVINPERLTRYRTRLTHVAVDAKCVAMYDSKDPSTAFMSYVSGCYEPRS